MSLARRAFAWALAGSLVAAAPFAHAQARATPASNAAVATDPTARAALIAERKRVRAELDSVNAAVDALKHADRGMRDDYRLRARLADAEALARRLTEIDARLGGAPGPRVGPSASLSPEPTAAATDGPAELDAKADILADQARRVALQADGLKQRAQQLKARQDLRRHVGQMEHDPFAPLEGSKRRAITSAAAPQGTTLSTPPADKGAGGGTTAGDVATPAAPSTPAVTTGGASDGRGATGPSSATFGTGHALVGPASGPTPTGSAASGGSEGTTLSVQLRDLLDPSTVAQLRKLETSGAPGASVEALERAAAALRARADRLAAQSQSLRARAHTP